MQYIVVTLPKYALDSPIVRAGILYHLHVTVHPKLQSGREAEILSINLYGVSGVANEHQEITQKGI